MKRLLVLAAIFTSGAVFGLYLRGIPPTALAAIGDGTGGVVECATRNGDVNGDGKVDLSDATTILGHLFLGNPTELVGLCDTPKLEVCQADLSTKSAELVKSSAQVASLQADLATSQAALASCQEKLAQCQAAKPSGLPDTGQTKCYDGASAEVPCDGTTCPGQDGFYQTGCRSEGRFVDNGDGTVTDNCTGLMWQKETADTNGDGKIDDADRLQGCGTLAYCENLSFAGHDDWRLPNVRELQSIADYGRIKPAIDPVFGALSSSYFSSTRSAVFTNFAWYVDFSGGGVDGGGDRANVYHVRAVRNAP